MTSWVLWVSGGHPHPRVRTVKPGDGTSVMVAPGKNHLKQKRSVSMALFLTQNLFVASGIDYLIYLTRPSHRGCNRSVPRAGLPSEVSPPLAYSAIKSSGHQTKVIGGSFSPRNWRSLKRSRKKKSSCSVLSSADRSIGMAIRRKAESTGTLVL